MVSPELSRDKYGVPGIIRNYQPGIINRHCDSAPQAVDVGLLGMVSLEFARLGLSAPTLTVLLIP